MVDNKQQHKRLKLLIKKTNKQRKKQAKQIDLLCNDFITANRDFIQSLGKISFAADFYESIVGLTNLNLIFTIADKLIKNKIDDINIIFVLRQKNNFKLYTMESQADSETQNQWPHDDITSELVDNICKSNKVCTLEDLFVMGFEGNLRDLKKFCTVTIPLTFNNLSSGFILLYRPSEKILNEDHCKYITAITPGLTKAILSCENTVKSTS